MAEILMSKPPSSQQMALCVPVCVCVGGWLGSSDLEAAARVQLECQPEQLPS